MLKGELLCKHNTILIFFLHTLCVLREVLFVASIVQRAALPVVDASRAG